MYIGERGKKESGSEMMPVRSILYIIAVPAEVIKNDYLQCTKA